MYCNKVRIFDKKSLCFYKIIFDINPKIFNFLHIHIRSAYVCNKIILNYITYNRDLECME